MAPTPKKRAPRKTVAKKEAVEAPAPATFTVTLTTAGQMWTSSADTLEDALLALPKPEKLMQKGDLTISDGERSNTLHFVPAQLKRLFMSKRYLNVRVKSLMLGLR